MFKKKMRIKMIINITRNNDDFVLNAFSKTTKKVYSVLSVQFIFNYFIYYMLYEYSLRE